MFTYLRSDKCVQVWYSLQDPLSSPFPQFFFNQYLSRKTIVWKQHFRTVENAPVQVGAFLLFRRVINVLIC